MPTHDESAIVRQSESATGGGGGTIGAGRLARAFYASGSISLAQRLIGQRFVRVLDDGTRLAGIIVETEAYLGVKDRAAHSFGGRRTDRNEVMYGQAGTAYVYFTYGMHFCMNVVCGKVGEPVAVLLRALEPVEGINVMRANRERRARLTKLKDRDLCSGPGRLCEAMGIRRRLNGVDLVTNPELFIEPGKRYGPRALVRTTRIGIASAQEWVHRPLRWYLKGNEHVSVRVKGTGVVRGEQSAKI
jgi:DNA-3-methyladenine glycosylase